MVLDKLNSQGANDFIPNFQKDFSDIIREISDNTRQTIAMCDKILLRDMPINGLETK